MAAVHFFIFLGFLAASRSHLSVRGRGVSGTGPGLRAGEQPEAEGGVPGQQLRRHQHRPDGRAGYAAERLVHPAAHCRGEGQGPVHTAGQRR